MSRLNYLPVNWVDGMKINKNNFIDTENAIIDKLNLVASLNLSSNNYGLLPIEPGKLSSLDFSLDIDDQQAMHIRLAQCNAITRGGVIIDIDTFKGESQSNKIFSVEGNVDLRKLTDGEYFVILTINPFERIPIGQSNPEEKPPRNPFVGPSYSLSVANNKNINIKELGKFFLPIGLLNVSSGKAELIKDYIPPCSSVSAHPRLISFHNNLSDFWSTLEVDILNIISKIHLKRQKSTLSSSVHLICIKLLDFISVEIINHRWHTIHQPPINMFGMILSMARLFRNTIETLPHKHKEEVINYFTDWCNLRTGEFENLLYVSLNINFNQENISDSIYKISEFIEVMRKLFVTLSGLDYIGKQKETGIFVKEEQSSRISIEQNDVREDHHTRRSFLAD